MASDVRTSYVDLTQVRSGAHTRTHAPCMRSNTAVRPRPSESIAQAKGWDHDEVAVYDRSQVETAKSQNEIGYSVLRGGDIVGEHTAYFATMGERLELTHKASSRMTFALGAIRAAQWLQNKPVGLYDMQDVLDLK